MNIKRILSVVFILMVMLSSTGYTSPNDFMMEPDELPIEIGTQICEDSDVDLLEFRQTITTLVSSSSRTSPQTAFHEASVQLFTKIEHVQYYSFLLRHLSEKPSVKLFIDHGVLVI